MGTRNQSKGLNATAHLNTNVAMAILKTLMSIIGYKPPPQNLNSIRLI